MKGTPSKRIALKVDVLKDRKIYCSQARSCIFRQAGAVKGLNIGLVQRSRDRALQTTDIALGILLGP